MSERKIRWWIRKLPTLVTKIQLEHIFSKTILCTVSDGFAGNFWLCLKVAFHLTSEAKKSAPMWRVGSLVLYTTHISNLRKCVSGNVSFFEMVRNVWALTSRLWINFVLRFYVGMTLFWLHLNLYICIPWLNKLPVTFAKQMPLYKLKILLRGRVTKIVELWKEVLNAVLRVWWTTGLAALKTGYPIYFLCSCIWGSILPAPKVIL